MDNAVTTNGPATPTSGLPAELDNLMVREANRQLLRYAAGRVMFCPGCDTCLDCATTVNVELAIGASVSSKTICATCFDKVRGAFERAAQAHGGTLDVVDGRVWFARPARTGRKARVS